VKARKPLIGVAVLAAVIAVAWAALRTSIPTIDQPTADLLSATADRWCEQWPDRKVLSDEWPMEVRQLCPQSVWVTPDGVYIKRGSRFVEEWGVFVHRSGSALKPSGGIDPSYRPLRGRVYWYEVKG
jgi:hypothetical protein